MHQAKEGLGLDIQSALIKREAQAFLFNIRQGV